MKPLLALCLLFVAISPLFGGEDPHVDPIRKAVDASEWKDALELAEKWVSEEPGSAEAHYWLAISLRSKMEAVSKIRAMASVGKYTNALERALEIDPKLVDALQEHIGYLIHAPGIAGGDRKNARVEISALQKIEPVAAQEMRFELAVVEENPDEQMAALRALRSLEPDNPTYGFQEALLKIQEAQYEDAEKLLLEAEKTDVDEVALAASYQRARWRVIANREVPVALDLLTSYLVERGDGDLLYAPMRAAAFWRIGLAHELLGDRQAAIEALETSVQLDPDFKQAAKDLKRVRRGG